MKIVSFSKLDGTSRKGSSSEEGIFNLETIMSEFMPATPDKPSDQWSTDDVRRIFAGMTDGGVRVTYQHGELMDQPSEEVVEAGYFGPELTPKEHYDYLVERGCSVEEIEAVHNLRMDKDGMVSEIGEDDINEKEEVIYEI